MTTQKLIDALFMLLPPENEICYSGFDLDSARLHGSNLHFITSPKRFKITMECRINKDYVFKASGTLPYMMGIHEKITTGRCQYTLIKESIKFDDVPLQTRFDRPLAL